MPQLRANSRSPSILWLILTLLLAALCLWFAFRKVDWAEMLMIGSQARLEYLLLAAVMLTISFWLRGIRWGLLLNSGLAHSLTMFWGIAVGYLGNAFLPARAGEVIRAMFVGGRLSISRSYVLATAIVERVIDVAVLVIVS